MEPTVVARRVRDASPQGRSRPSLLRWPQSTEPSRPDRMKSMQGFLTPFAMQFGAKSFPGERINLTGDSLWRSSAKVGAGKFRLLRPLPQS